MKVFGRHDDRVVGQLKRCVDAEDGARGVLCADGHLGYSQPIGGAVAYRDHISVAGVGYDIGCGNKAVLTDLRRADVAGSLPAIMDEIHERISFGVGRENEEPIEHEVLDAIREAPFASQRKLLDLAASQLGTVGAGNHYVDLFADEEDRVWVGVHFGSRGFGHKTATGFLSLSRGGDFQGHASEGGMDSPPVLIAADSDLGASYVQAMSLAGAYAYAGRDVVVDKVLSILGATAREEVHNHHNFAWRERHDGEDWWVVRKGCTPAFPGQRGFVGATMAGVSVVLEGVDSPESEAALFSTVHGAGRAMSRTEAAGKRRRRWACTNRDCGWVQPPGTAKPSSCPDCGATRLTKRWVMDRSGRIDFDAVREELRAAGIELRGGAADEAPGAYKDLREVLAAHGDTVRVLHELRPLGVAMAGAGTFDPFRD